jgi:type IV secretory pathway VirB6-like protein
MNRGEFIKQLEEALLGRVNSSVISENINYYNGYINEEINKGMREEDVLDSLGDPWVIGKTIIQTQGGQGDFNIPAGEARSSMEDYSDYTRDDYFGDNYNRGRNPYVKVHNFGIISWKQKLAIIAAVVLVIAVIVVVVVGVLSLLAPIIIPLIVILILLRIFRK